MCPTRTRRIAFVAIAAAIVLAASEVFSLAAIRLTRSLLVEPIRTTRHIYRQQTAELRRLLSPDSSRLLMLDPLLGWRYRAGHRDSANTMNSEGLRGMREYPRQAGRGVLRVAAFGDSFVYGSEVSDPDAWPAQLERLFPPIEVLNYGVGGYGVDQAYLRFCAEGTAFSPTVVLIGFVTDDLRRVINVYRRFLWTEELPLVKPRFELDGSGGLVLLPNPLAQPADYARYLDAPEDVTALGAHDAWYHAAIYRNPVYDYSATVRLLTNLWLRSAHRHFAADRPFSRGEFDPGSTAFRIQLALFQRFAASVRAAGARPIVVFFPDRESAARAWRGKRTMFAPLVDSVAARGMEYVDATAAFVTQPRADVSAWFMSDGHYSPAGNRVVAEWLGRALERSGGGGDGAVVRQASAATFTQSCPNGDLAARTRPLAGDGR